MRRLSGTLVAIVGLTFAGQISSAQIVPDSVEAGRARFNVRCAGCHGQDGLGGERAPAIGKGSQQGLDDEKKLRGLIGRGIANRGMPAFSLPAAELDQVVAFARSRILPVSKTA